MSFIPLQWTRCSNRENEWTIWARGSRDGYCWPIMYIFNHSVMAFWKSQLFWRKRSWGNWLSAELERATCRGTAKDIRSPLPGGQWTRPVRRSGRDAIKVLIGFGRLSLMKYDQAEAAVVPAGSKAANRLESAGGIPRSTCRVDSGRSTQQDDLE
jgi:hypothetical protein